jgi:hypothetical protein
MLIWLPQVEAAPRPDYGGAVLRVLVEEGICTSLDECMREDYVFGEYEKFTYLNVYGVRDERVISRIASSVSKELKKGTNEKVVVSFFFSPHKNYTGLSGIFKKADVVMEVHTKSFPIRTPASSPTE